MEQTVVVVGSQWGDEGKGKIVDYLAGKYDFTVRYNGGSNAGHTIMFFDEKTNKEEKYGLHLLPSGVFRKSCKLVIGNGVIVHLPTLLHELEMVKKAGFDLKDRLFLSDRCHIVLEMHKLVDGLQEGERQTQKIGTTGYHSLLLFLNLLSLILQFLQSQCCSYHPITALIIDIPIYRL